MAKVFEYKVIQVSSAEAPSVEATLNQLGALGWELLHAPATAWAEPAASAKNMLLFFYLKREV